MQHVAMFLRSVPHWEIVEPLPDIGKELVVNSIHGQVLYYIVY
jgi:hypothetical protein